MCIEKASSRKKNRRSGLVVMVTEQPNAARLRDGGVSEWVGKKQQKTIYK